MCGHSSMLWWVRQRRPALRDLLFQLYFFYFILISQSRKLMKNKWEKEVLVPMKTSWNVLPWLRRPKLLEECVLSHFSHVWIFETLWTVARQAPLSMGFSRQEHWSGLPCPPPGDLPVPGIEPMSLIPPALEVDSLPLSHQGSYWIWCGPDNQIVLEKLVKIQDSPFQVYSSSCWSLKKPKTEVKRWLQCMACADNRQQETWTNRPGPVQHWWAKRGTQGADLQEDLLATLCKQRVGAWQRAPPFILCPKYLTCLPLGPVPPGGLRSM